MSTADDPDAILRDLEASLGEIAEPDVPDVTQMSDLELSTYLNDARDKLQELGQMMRPTTQEARDLHSQRAAALVELQNRRRKP